MWCMGGQWDKMGCLGDIKILYKANAILSKMMHYRHKNFNLNYSNTDLISLNMCQVYFFCEINIYSWNILLQLVLWD